MLKHTRQTLAIISIILVTLLFVDFTGTASHYFGWMAKIQFLPALMALNIGVVVSLLLLTLVVGRVYCSVICPLGIMQDIFARVGKFAKKNRYTFTPALNVLRYVMLCLMVMAILFGINAFVAVLAPYSAYGRIAQSFLQPIWIWGNNLLAGWSENAGNFVFYLVDLWPRNVIVMSIAGITLVVLAILAYRNGRTYCNTICPVGTVLGFVSKFAFMRPVIDVSKCVNCSLCSKNCKSSCIDYKNHTIDYSRCVDCMDCIGKCSKKAISYRYVGVAYKSGLETKTASRSGALQSGVEANATSQSQSRRGFMTTIGVIATTAALHAEDKIVDGGLAAIEDKKIPKRKTKIVPPGALSIKNLENHCTACQLCIAECPNGVLRPSSEISSLMQPESSYERGYCRPECTRCSEVCPTGAIRPITKEEKTAISIGHAVWVGYNCIPLRDGVECGNCARHCPVGAILMVPSDRNDENSVKIPTVNEARCIGCGACENLCPSRPLSAIYVEGKERHREV